MAKSYEPNPKRFWTYFFTSMIFLSVMAVVIIKRKQAKEKENPPQKVQPY
jgi:hypothetical protein